MNVSVACPAQLDRVEGLDLNDLFVVTRENLDQLVQNISLAVPERAEGDTWKLCGTRW
jgi:hypothetical protein